MQAVDYLPVKKTYHSFVDGPGPCPACGGVSLRKSSTKTNHPYRFRHYKCQECGYTFQSIDVDSRYILEKSGRG
jgi:transposase-like protein